MKIKLLMDLPIDPKHGALRGRIFDVSSERKTRERGSPHFYFLGDAGEEVGVLIGEYAVASDPIPHAPGHTCAPAGDVDSETGAAGEHDGQDANRRTVDK